MSLEQARAFLYRVLPWDADPGVYMNIHWTVSPPDHKGKPFWNGRPCTNIEEAVAAVQYAMTKAKHARDVYVCLSSQARADQKTVNGHTFPIAVRGQQTAVRLKSLFVDLDVKDGAYADTAAAIQALAAFLTQSGIPAPTHTVFSGSGGMHVYWALERAITTAEWQPLANALAEATRRLGLKADTGCTVDSARVLRVPGTLNRKSDPPRPVTLAARVRPDIPLETMRAALMPFMGAQVIPLRPGVANVNDELSAGISGAGKAPPVALDTVAESCGFVREALATGGAGYDNPLWNLTTLVATFAEDGRAQAHRMAAGHPAYTAEETDALYDRKLKEREEKNLGWPSCQSVQNAGCTSCAGCPLLAMGKSPLNFGRASAAPGASVAGAAAGVGGFQQDQDLPGDFVRDAQGFVYKRVIAEGVTDHRQVVPYPLYGAWLQEPPRALGFLTRFGNPPRERKIVIPATVYNAGGVEFAQLLGSLGIDTNPRQRQVLQEFIVSWVQHLNEIKGSLIPTSSYGWSVVNGKFEGFSYGGRVWLAVGERPAVGSDPVLEQQYAPCGELQPWIDAARMITDQRRPELDAIIAASFGAPLVKLVGAMGLLISAYSTESGVGKSSAMKIAQAVWGNPRDAMQQLNDTTNSTLNKLGEIRHLPMFWDELKTEEETDRFVSFAFQLTQGKEKSRLRADATQRKPGTWNTIVVAASNDSLLDYVARKTKTTTAGVHRVLEYTVRPAPATMTTAEADALLGELDDNFGQAGLVYAKYIGANYARVKEALALTRVRFEKELNAPTVERFWIQTITCVYVGALCANKLGLTSIDLPTLRAFLFEAVEGMRKQVKAQPIDLSDPMVAQSHLYNYLSAMRARHTLDTDRIHLTNGKPPLGSVKPKGVIDFNRLDTIYVQIGHDMQLIRFSSTHFRTWLGQHKLPIGVVCEALKKQCGMRVVRGRLGGGVAGLHLPPGAEYLYEIDTAGSGFQAAVGAPPAQQAQNSK